MSSVWINGELVDKSEAKISVFDHGFLYGDGVWEHFRAFGGKLFRGEEAMSWLFTKLHNNGITIPMSQQELTTAIGDTLAANDRSEGYIRVVISRGVGTLGPDPRKLEPTVIIIAEEYRPFPDEIYEHGLNAVTVESSVWSHGRPPLARLLGQDHIVKAKVQALNKGCLEAILVDEHGRLYGATEGSILRVMNGILQTIVGEVDFGYSLAGDLATMADVLRSSTWPKSEVQCNAWDTIAESDELLLAGTSCGVIGIVQVDGKPVGTGREGPITKRIREAYRKLTRGEA
jgi:branched-chain amino acid aminotransferase